MSIEGRLPSPSKCQKIRITRMSSRLFRMRMLTIKLICSSQLKEIPSQQAKLIRHRTITKRVLIRILSVPQFRLSQSAEPSLNWKKTWIFKSSKRDQVKSWMIRPQLAQSIRKRNWASCIILIWKGGLGRAMKISAFRIGMLKSTRITTLSGARVPGIGKYLISIPLYHLATAAWVWTTIR